MTVAVPIVAGFNGRMPPTGPLHLAVNDYIHLGPHQTPAPDALRPQSDPLFQPQVVQPLFQVFEGHSEVDQRAQHHVAADPGERLDVEHPEPVTHSRSPSRRPRTIRAAA
jgi:hypothetical protein